MSVDDLLGTRCLLFVTGEEIADVLAGVGENRGVLFGIFPISWMLSSRS